MKERFKSRSGTKFSEREKERLKKERNLTAKDLEDGRIFRTSTGRKTRKPQFKRRFD